MRRTMLALTATGLLAGCAAAPAEVAGPAAPVAVVSADPTPAPTTTAPSATRTPTPSPTPSPTPTPRPVRSRTPSPTPTPDPGPPGLPLAYRNTPITGFGATVTVPVPADWVREDITAARRRTVDFSPPNGSDLLFLRVDLTPRGRGNAEDVARGLAAAQTRPGYRQPAFMEVTDRGDDAVDWFFTFDQDGIPMAAADEIVLAGTAQIAVYFHYPAELSSTYQQMLPRILGGIRITA